MYNVSISIFLSLDVESLTIFIEFATILELCVDGANNGDLESFKQNLRELSVIVNKCCDENAVQSVMKTGQEFRDLGQFMHAICTYLCLTNVLLATFVNNQNMDSLNLSLDGVVKASSELINAESSSITVLKNIVVLVIKDSIQSIANFEGITVDKKTETTVWCYHHLSECYVVADLYIEAYDTAIAAIEIMKKKYPNDYEKYRVISLMNVQLVKICELLGKTEETKQFTAEAAKSLQKSTDWDGSTEMKESAMDRLIELKSQMEMLGQSEEECVIM